MTNSYSYCILLCASIYISGNKHPSYGRQGGQSKESKGKSTNKAPKKLWALQEQILIEVVLKDAKSVSEIVGQEKEEINEGGSSQSVAEVQLYISKEQNIQTFENKKNDFFFFIFL